MVIVKRSVVLRGRERREGMNKQRNKKFWGGKDYPYNIIMIYIYHHTSVHLMYNMKIEP